MAWRLTITLLLCAIAALLVWDRDRVLDVLRPGETPHEQYARSLAAAGLADTALARDWLAAAENALRDAESGAPPLETTIQHDVSRPRAYGFRLDLKRGRVLRTSLQVESAEPARIFVDVFRLGEAGEREHVVSAPEGSTSVEHEIRRDGTYIIRIQPELLRGGSLRIAHRTTAALTFPVAGRDGSAVGSFFRDPRDGGRREHHGVDIFAPRDTAVVAASAGIVTSVATTAIGGNVVWVRDPRRGQSHYYAHLSRQAVATGQRVAAGEIIGYVGNTGNARGTPPHLHFGIYASREGPIDPLPFVSDSSRGAKPAQRRTGTGG